MDLTNKDLSYTIIKQLGSGRYGEVFEAHMCKDNSLVAIKVIGCSGEIQYNVLKEISILKQMCHQNIIKLLYVSTNYISVLLYFERCELDLAKYLDSYQQFLSVTDIKALLTQLCLGVLHFHNIHIIHRDLKPENLLLAIVDNKYVLKIADFGLSCQYTGFYKQYDHLVVTLLYRAPELLLKTTQYGKEIDIWSIACIFTTMYGKTLFNGNDEQTQLRAIFDITGIPIITDFPHIPTYPAWITLYDKIKTSRSSLSDIMNTMDDDAIDLLSKLICLNPLKRLNVNEILQHKFLTQ